VRSLLKPLSRDLVAAVAAWGLVFQANAIDERPSISIAHENQKAKVTFAGTLLAAETLAGPWSAITNADPPYAAELTSPLQFYRAGIYPTNSIFSSTSVVVLNLTGPFQAYFDLAFAGLPDGMIPPVREKPYFDGTLRMPGFVVPVTIRVRGNSSLQECPFPKLKFKVSPANRVGTPFADAREIKIITHCAEGGQGTIGRLREQAAIFREGVAYEVSELMGFLTPRLRRALIEYHDTTPPTNAATSVGWEITRQAVLLEDLELVAARLGGRVLLESELPWLVAADFDAQLVADLQLFNALLGNWDYSLGWDSRGVWNMDVLELPDGTGKRLMPVPGDFDLSSWVTGVVRRSSPWDYHPELGDLERETRYQLEKLQQRVEPPLFASARQRFVMKREALEAHVGRARLDEEGRVNAQHHLSVFFAALDLFP